MTYTNRICYACQKLYSDHLPHICETKNAYIDPITEIDRKLTDALKLINDARWMLSEAGKNELQNKR